MPKTTNLGLELITDNTIKFKDFRESLNGQGDGVNIPLSNMQILDNTVGDLDNRIKTININPTVIAKTINFPITIKKRTTIYFDTNYSNNILSEVYMYNDVNGQNVFPCLRLNYGGGYTFIYGGGSLNITTAWNSDFAENFENAIIKWDKLTKTLTYKAEAEGVINTCNIPEGYEFNGVSISNYTYPTIDEMEQRIATDLGDINTALTAILGV